MILLVTVVKLRLLPGLAVARPMGLPLVREVVPPMVVKLRLLPGLAVAQPLEKEAVPPMMVGPMAHSEPGVAQTMDLPLVREGTQEHAP
jgi:hypothetical protein